jgi:hypothetical protein
MRGELSPVISDLNGIAGAEPVPRRVLCVDLLAERPELSGAPAVRFVLA